VTHQSSRCRFWSAVVNSTVSVLYEGMLYPSSVWPDPISTPFIVMS